MTRPLIVGFQVAGDNLSLELSIVSPELKGITVIGATRETIVEEVSDAYKDVSDVVDTCHYAGLSKKVARLRPLGVIKG